MDALPIDDILPELVESLRSRPRAVLQAPPGAGKTTRVPLALLEAGIAGPEGRIVMLEPRRLAARAAAERMAQTLGESVGDTVGYRIRGESRVGRGTRIEVVTEGILTRMLQADPSLPGISVVIFDEFHERSLNADFGLALCLEVAEALREDLVLLVMSATLDAAPVGDLMAAPVLTSQGRSFPVAIEHIERPPPRETRLPDACAGALRGLLGRSEGGVLVFLPGEGEIRRLEALLGDLPGCVVRPLYGALDAKAQRAALAPPPGGQRKIVLATSIAETSLTIPDVRVVLDCGRSRRARFDPGSGMARLVTERVSRAEADQRAGRAGRVAEGLCHRLWTRGEEGALAAFPPAEIEVADLAGLALELAMWGAEPSALAFLTQPPEAALAEARALLRGLGALDARDGVTSAGREMARLPLHPRLAAMLLTAGKPAAPLAALLNDRDPIARGAPVDLALRMEALADARRFARERGFVANRGALERIGAEARRLENLAPEPGMGLSLAEMASLAYPDRIAGRRKGEQPRFVLSGGKGAILAEEDPLAGAPFLVVTDTDGNPREARIRQATRISAAEIRAQLQTEWVDSCAWDKREGRVVARRQERLGAVVLEDRAWKDAAPEAIATAMLEGVRELGLAAAMSEAARRFVARVALVRGEVPDLPDLGEPALMARLEDWLLPHLGGLRSAADWRRFDLLPALRAQLDWTQQQAVDRAAPAHFETPLGRKIPIDYSGEVPRIELRLQEMFGQVDHPTVAGQPVQVVLLSPAHRPVQVTMDLPGFWDSSYADVRRDMRGRYPKHPWPEDPRAADPTLRAKPRR